MWWLSIWIIPLANQTELSIRSTLVGHPENQPFWLNCAVMQQLFGKLFFALFLFSFGSVFSQQHAGPVKWLSFEEAARQSAIKKKPIFIDVYTDWCGWCKVMDKNTFADPRVAEVLNEAFYPVKFDAEQEAEVVFRGTTFKFVAQGNRGYHQLAAALLNNKLSYPTVVFLDEDFGMIQPLPGYQEPVEFHKVIRFIGEGHYKTMKWEQWQQIYRSPFGAGQ